MRVRLSDIPVSGVNINDTISLRSLNDRMDEGPANDIEFLDEPTVSVFIRPEKGGAELSGEVKTRYRQVCPRCLTAIEHRLEESLNLILKGKSVRPGADRKVSHKEWEDGVGILYFDGEHIDLEDIVQETLILSINPLGKEHSDCNVLEWSDEQNKDQESGGQVTNLGKLLRNAGVN